jgi:molybdopterin synthase catalytic subunit
MKVLVSVRVKLFARLREQAGAANVELELPAGSTVAEVHAALVERFPSLEPDRRLIRPALNQGYASWEDEVRSGDEVALIPPVSGGAGDGHPKPEASLEITTEALDAHRLEAAVVHHGAGAVCTFTGIVRDSSRGEVVTHLEYEAYTDMAIGRMREIVAEIAERWPEARVAMAHRTGRLEVGEASVVVSVSCPHRAEAFAACRWGIDRLKESVPIWKKEFGASGAAWIEGPDARPV